MSRENVELARAQYERWNAGDLDAWVEAFDPEAEYLSSMTAAFDGRGEYAGHEGIRRFISEYLEGWEYFRLEPTEYLDAGARVVVVMRATACGRGSRVQVERDLAHVGRFEGPRRFATRALRADRRPSKPWGSRSRRCRGRTWRS